RFRTANGPAAAPYWTDSGSGTLPARFVTRIRVDPTDVNTVYAAFGGFSTPNLWKTLDGGSSWTPASGSSLTGLPAVPVRDVAVFAPQPQRVSAATAIRLLPSQAGGSTWSAPQQGPATVAVDEHCRSG